MTESEPIGSITEEAFKLFRAMNGASTTADPADSEKSSTHVCTATWCPVCQVVGFVHDNPEAVAKVSQSAATLARSLRDLLDAALTPEEKQ
ncbi:MAG: hypothetical protein JWR83_2042 [Aeromicrobium sp.]|nr:hypothetical protein [Aeromicrobium sp.]